MATVQEHIIDDLRAQHQQIKLLFAQVSSTRSEDKNRLDGGETVACPRPAGEPDAKTTLARLYELGVAASRFGDRLPTLRDAVTPHADTDERWEFGRAREVVEPDKLQGMMTAMRVAAALSPSRPQAEALPNGAADLPVGPPLTVFDRVRHAPCEGVHQGSREGL
jgi:hypothetical protein